MTGEFYICVHSQFGPTYQFRLFENQICYHFSTLNDRLPKDSLPSLEYQPNEKEIEAFWTAVESLNIETWEKEYHNPDIPKGPQWEVCMKYNGKSQISNGIAAFPGSPHPAYSQDFIHLINAIREILNWMPFG